MYFYTGNLNLEVISTIHLCASCNLVAGLLVRFLVKPPVQVLLDRFWPQDRSRGLQIRFQTSLRTSSSPRNRLNTSNSENSSPPWPDRQNHDFREIKIKSDGGCYKPILTVNSFELFPDRSDPKRVCPYTWRGSRNRLAKSPMCLHP